MVKHLFKGYCVKLLAILFIAAIATVVSETSLSPQKAWAADSRIEPAISWAQDRLGSNSFDYWCLKFVQDAYQDGAKTSITRYDSAKIAADKTGAAANKNTPPPRGSFVYYDWWGHVNGVYANYGHVGISLGNGQIIHAMAPKGVQVTSTNIGLVYIGWAAPNLSPPISDFVVDTGTAGTPSSITVPPTSSTGNYTISWGKSPTSGVEYVLQQSRKEDFSLRYEVYRGTATSANITGRTDGETYYYRVKAIKSGYKDSAWRTGENGCAVSISGYADLSQLSVPSTVTLGQNFDISFTLKEIRGASKTFESVRVAILRSDNSHLFDFATYSNVTVPANDTYSRTARNYLYASNPPGTYKVFVQGKIGGEWFDFGTTGSGADPHPRSFSAVLPPLETGMVVREGNKATVYYIHNSKKWPIASAEIFLAMGFSWEGVLSYPDTTLSKVPNGQNIVSNGLLGKLGTKIYVFENNKWRYLPNWAYMDCRGGQRREDVIPVTQALFDLYGQGANIEPCIAGAPTSISVPASNSTGSYTVSWGASATSGVSYVLEEATNASFTSGRRTAYSSTGTSANISGRSSGVTYYYRVKATKSDYTDSGWYTDSKGCAVQMAVAAPTSINIPASNSTGSYTVSWGVSATSGVSYVLEEATNASFSSGRRTAYSSTGTSANISGRSSGVTYFYRVKATRSGYTDSGWHTDSKGCAVSISHTVTPSAGSGGSISPSGGQSVNHGATTSFTLTPDIGYSVAGVGGTCGGNLSGNTYTTNAVIENCTVQSTFSLNSYTVTFQDHDGTELKSESVNHGSAATAPPSPTRTGYSFSGWSPAFDNITSELTVVAQYTEDSDENQLLLTVSTSADGAYTNNAELSIIGSVKNGSGNLSVSINGQPAAVKAGGTFSHVLWLLEGANSVEVVAEDDDDKRAEDKRIIVLDTQAPQLVVSSPPEGSNATNSGNLLVSGTYEEPNLADIQIVLNKEKALSADIYDDNFSLAVGLFPGDNLITITAADLAGNNAEVQRELIYSNRAPELSIIQPSEGANTSASALLLKGTVHHDYLPVSVEIIIDGQVFKPEVIGGGFSHTLTFGEMKTYFIEILAHDGAGNTARMTRTVTYGIYGPSGLLGDINLDGKVDMADVLFAMQAAIGLVTLSEEAVKLGDVAPLVDGAPQPDGKIDVGDALIILKKVLGQENF